MLLIQENGVLHETPHLLLVSSPSDWILIERMEAQPHISSQIQNLGGSISRCCAWGYSYWAIWGLSCGEIWLGQEHERSTIYGLHGQRGWICLRGLGEVRTVCVFTNGRLCQIIAVLPATSVDCERGFSNLNRIKNDCRNKLQTQNLEALIRVSTTSMDSLTLSSLHSKDLILAWRRSKSRRPGGKGDRVHQYQSDEMEFWTWCLARPYFMVVLVVLSELCMATRYTFLCFNYHNWSSTQTDKQWEYALFCTTLW